MHPFVLPFLALVFLIIYTKRLKNKRKKNGGKISLRKVLPRVQWTFLNLFLLDGIISLFKVRKYGVKIFEHMATRCGNNFKDVIPMYNGVVITDPQLIKKLLSTSNDGQLGKPKCIYNVLLPDLMKNGLVCADVNTWSSHRSVISPAFNYNSLPHYLNFINGAAKSLINLACSSAKSASGSINNDKMNELLDRETFNVVLGIIFGRVHVLDQEREQFHNAFHRCKELVVDRFLNPMLWFPPIWFLNSKKREMDETMKILDGLSFTVIDRCRMKSSTDSKERNGTGEKQVKVDAKVFECLVERMIKAGFNDRAIMDEVNTFGAAGYETVLIAIQFLVYHLAANPTHQEKCRMEIDKLLKTHNFDGESSLSLEHLLQLKYLERCVLESLRLTPPGPAFARQLESDLEIDEKYFLEAGQFVLIAPWVVHRNPEIYPNPEVFDPDRFLPENMKQRHSHSFIPFSMGSRNCIGWKVALLEMKVFASWILRHFDLSTTDKPDDVKLLFDITLKSERPYNIEYKLRKY